LKVETNSKIVRNRFLDNTYGNCERFYCPESDKRGLYAGKYRTKPTKSKYHLSIDFSFLDVK
jgi:hypothetical protein